MTVLELPRLMEIPTFKARMKKDGWVRFPGVLAPAFIDRLNHDLAEAYKVCRGIQIRNGVAEGMEGTAHHLIGQGDSFMELLETLPLREHLRAYFGGKFILNSMGGMFNLPTERTYLNNIHRDVRTFSSSLPLMLNMLIMLDDFTEENGATYVLSGSHLRDDKPTEAEFFSRAQRLTGKAGDIVVFDSNMWHAAGKNTTQAPRRGITPLFTPPYLKQGCDYPRVLGYEYAAKLSEQMKQLLGYNSRVPANLDEWYQPADKRMYKAGEV